MRALAIIVIAMSIAEGGWKDKDDEAAHADHPL
jgi:hypothetical protein